MDEKVKGYLHTTAFTLLVISLLAWFLPKENKNLNSSVLKPANTVANEAQTPPVGEVPVANEAAPPTNMDPSTNIAQPTDVATVTNIAPTSVSSPVKAGSVSALRQSGPIIVDHDGQVIECLDIRSTSGAAISINRFKNITIKNCKITTSNGQGISAYYADGLQIQNCDIKNASASKGVNPNASADELNINIYGSNGVKINNVRLVGGSSGVYIASSSNVNISNVEGYNFKGPFPRGQLVQFNTINTASLDGFSCVNDVNNSYPEDNISVYKSQNITIKNGLIDGNNSITGCGVMVESGSNNCLIQNVDALNQGNASFVSWGSSNVTFRDVRTKNNHASSVRGANASGSLIFASSSGATGTSFINATYFNPANPENIVLNYKAPAPMLVKDIRQQDFVAKSPLRLKFGWE